MEEPAAFSSHAWEAFYVVVGTTAAVPMNLASLPNG